MECWTPQTFQFGGRIQIESQAYPAQNAQATASAYKIGASMDRIETRRFNIFDYITVIFAFTCFIYAIIETSDVATTKFPGHSSSLLFRVLGIAGTAVEIACCGSVFPIALLILWFRRPRVCLRILIRKPGFSACLIWSLSIAFFFIAKLSSLLIQAREKMNPVDFEDIAKTPVKFCVEYMEWHFISLAYSLAVVWLFQRLAGIWEPEASWIDRVGRLFGFYTIFVLILRMFTFT